MNDFLSSTGLNVSDLHDRPEESSLSTGAHTCCPRSGEPEHTCDPQGCPQAQLLSDQDQQHAEVTMSPAERSRAHAAAGRASYAAAAQERFERYVQLRRGGYTIQQAAWELGITRRHADRYEKRRNEHGAA